jgi:hypothetical protein
VLILTNLVIHQYQNDVPHGLWRQEHTGRIFTRVARPRRQFGSAYLLAFFAYRSILRDKCC